MLTRLVSRASVAVAVQHSKVVFRVGSGTVWKWSYSQIEEASQGGPAPARIEVTAWYQWFPRRPPEGQSLLWTRSPERNASYGELRGGGQMYYVSFGAVRRRTGQTVLVLILAVLVAAAGAAGPWYGLTVASRAAGNEVTAAPAAQRVVSIQRAAGSGTAGDPRAALDALAAQVGGLLTLPGGAPLTGLVQNTSFSDPRKQGAVSGLPVAYRDGFCAHVRLTGACPASSGEAAISADAAHRLGLSAGDQIDARPVSSAGSLHLRITAVYEVADPAGEYWTDRLFRSAGDLDPAFTTLDTFRQPALGQPVLAYDLPVPAALLRGDDNYDLNGVLNAAESRFAAAQLGFGNPVGDLADRVRARRLTVLEDVLIALGEVIVLGWFAIGLAGRFTGRDRRADAALLKLRGSTRGRMLRLVLGQHVIPLFGAAVAGLPAGFAAAWLVAGSPPVRSEWWLAFLLSAGAVVVVLAGALAALTAVDAFAQRAPVATLLRRVPSARRDWRSGVVDLAFVALAAGAVYQARSGGLGVLGVVAPGLVALAVGLLLARLLRWTADRAGGVAVRAGRLRAGLTAVQISRQPGTDRIFAFIVVAVAMLALALGGLAAGRTERAARAEVELGAPRVLTVEAASVTALEYAVRRADPAGRQAMAALVDTYNKPPLLAVDSARLASVAAWRPEYGPVTALAAAAGDARIPDPPPLITGTGLSLRVRSDHDYPVVLGAMLQHEATGAVVPVEFKGIGPGERTVTIPVKGCTAAPGCRLVALELYAGVGPDGKPVTGAVTITSLTQQNPPATILDTARLADARRWRTDFTGVALQVLAGTAGLSLSVAAEQAGEVAGAAVYPVDAPLPVPILLAGQPASEWRFEDATTTRFGGRDVPVRVAGTPGVLPVLGAAGLLADLDTVRRVASGAELGGTMQVWLAAGAPPSVLDALRREGLTVLADRTTAGLVAREADQAAVIVAPFDVFTAVLSMLLAAIMVAVVATVEREPQAEQLRALRVQGLARSVAVTSGYAGIVALVLTGLLGGLAAALVARPVAAVVAPPFPDGWRVIPPPGALGPLALALAGAFAALVLSVTAGLSVRPLVRRLRSAPAGGAQ